MDHIIKCILTDAVEGSAISYWAAGTKVLREEETNYVTSFKVRDNAPDGEPVKKGCKVISNKAILKARNALVNGDVPVRRDIAGQFVGKPEDWEYDGEGVDALVQAAFFGKIVYG